MKKNRAGRDTSTLKNAVPKNKKKTKKDSESISSSPLGAVVPPENDLYNQFIDPICITQKTKIVFVNNAWVKLFGYDLETVISKKIDITHIAAPRYVSSIKNIYSANYKTISHNHRFEFVCIDSKGSKKILESTISRINWKGKTLLLSVLRDITTIKNIFEEFRINESIFTEAQRIANVGNFIFDFVNQQFICSPHVFRILGKRKQALTPENFYQIICEEDRDYVRDKFNKAAIDHNAFDFEYKIKTSKGVIKTLKTKGEVKKYPGFFSPVILGIIQDITESKKSQLALKRAERKLRDVVEYSSNLFYSRSLSNKLKYVSPQAKEFMDWDPGDALVDWDQFLTDHPINKLGRMYFEQAVQTGIAQPPYQLQWKTQKGRILWVEVRETPIIKNNKVAVVVGSLTDITQQKVTEEMVKIQTHALEAAGNGIVITDSDGIVIFSNNAFSALTGYTNEEIYGKLLKMLKSGFHDQDFYENLWNTIKAGKIWRGEIINRRKDGSLYTEEQTITPVYNRQKEITHFIAIKLDVTERKKTEDKLRESEEKYRTLAEAAHEMIFIVNGKGLVTYANSFTAAQFNSTTDQIIGFPLSKFLQEESLSHQLANIQKVFDTSEAHYIESEIILPDKNLWLGTWLVPVKDKSGIVKEVLGIARDITARVNVEHALIESEERFRTVFEHSSIGIYRSTKEGKLLLANPAMLKILGYSSFEEVNKPNIVHNYLNKNDRELFQTIIEKDKVIRGFETQLVREDGQIITVTISSRLVKNSKTGEYFYEGVTEDITERKASENALIIAKEKAEQSDKIKTEFLAQISHEIRTPINVILSFTNLIQDEIKDIATDEVKSHFKLINQAGRRITRTIDMILNMSEIQIGSFELIKKRFDLFQDLLEEQGKEFASLAAEKNLEFELIKKTENTHIVADLYSIQQIFDNLLNNAIKYTPKGKVEVIVEPVNDRLCVSIKDTGIGISQEYLPHLFEPFSQEEHGYTRRFEGNGLGLALVKKYCEFNMLDISVESKKNRGTTFKVLFDSASFDKS